MPRFTPIPRGRLVYRIADSEPFFVLCDDRSKRLFIVEDPWEVGSACAGPFDPNDALRAWRIANVRVPEGCERGPWQWGIRLFETGPLPDRLDAWTRFDPSWLAPSVSRYCAKDFDEVVNEACCAPPQDAPRVAWGTSVAAYEEVELRALAASRGVESRQLARLGQLERDWNAHPAGSAVFAGTGASDGLVIVDLPPACRS